MRIVCVYTALHSASAEIAQRCIRSGDIFGYIIEPFPAVYWKKLDTIHKQLNLHRKYEPIPNTTKTTETTCPASRMANGTTHYMLYLWSMEHNEPICILEHDAMFVGQLPTTIEDGVIQISSHRDGQSTRDHWYNCTRANKMRKYQPDVEFKWNDSEGVVPHPLTGMNGTSGYIIGPKAAAKMVEYIREDGIAYADRVRTQWIGEGNLYLQIPQSVICDHKVKSTKVK